MTESPTAVHSRQRAHVIAGAWVLVLSACNGEPVFEPTTDVTVVDDDADTSGGNTGGDGGGGGGATGGATSTTTGSGGGGGTAGGSPVPTEPILWLFDGETGAIQAQDAAHDGAKTQSCGNDGAVTVSSSEAHTGNYSLRARVRQAWLEDDSNCTAVKAKILQEKLIAPEDGDALWHGWAVRVGSGGGYYWTTQWRSPGSENRSLRVTVRSDLQWTATAAQISDYAPYDLTMSPTSTRFGAVDDEGWHEFVAYLVLSSDDDGEYKLWHRRQGEDAWLLVHDADGQSANSDAFPFSVTHGIHGGHNWSASGDTVDLYFDEIRVGDENSSFDAVAPGSGTTP